MADYANVLILSGFLGSGKTTILLKLANHLRKQHGEDYRIAIIENEIGEATIDSDLIGQAGYSVTDMLGGCVCCTLLGQLAPTAAAIQKDLNPNLIIVEATGVAEPRSMAEAIEQGGNFTTRIATLVDASRWQRIRVPLALLLEQQISPAQVICINKVDLVSEADVSQTESDVRKLNEHAPIVRVCAEKELSDVDARLILG